MKHILVVFGGRSVEHDISIITGHVILAALAALPEVRTTPLYISRDGGWYTDPSLVKLPTFQAADFFDKLAKLPRASLTVRERLALVQPGFRTKYDEIDVVFPALHGTNGEDGSIQGLARLTGTPVVGCDVAASAVAMDKVLTKQVTAAAGVPSVDYVYFTADEWERDQATVHKRLGTLSVPVFVKPAHLGSSIGISRIERKAELNDAIELALHYDDKVIIEHAVPQAIEINCAVLGNNDITPSVLEQPRGQDAFLSFNDKYLTKGGSMAGVKGSVQIPAPLSANLTEHIQLMAAQAFKAIGGTGTARLDFLVDGKTKRVYLNEINPLPGSLQQHLWKASGISNATLVSRLVELAEDRAAAAQSQTQSFSSSVLTNTAGSKKLPT